VLARYSADALRVRPSCCYGGESGAGEGARHRRAAPRARCNKLDPFEAAADRLLGEGVCNAVVILRAIQAEGYAGGSAS
jgi:hypothetical protein